MKKLGFVFLLLTPFVLNAQPTPGFNTKIPAQIMTPDKVQTRIGTLGFFDGYPTKVTVQKVYNNLDFVRGVEAFLNGIPMASLEAIRVGFRSAGSSKPNQILIFDKLMDSNPLFLTGNTDTVYAGSFVDLEKDGPIVVEIPPGSGPGTVDDAYFRFVIDTGAPGPDKGKGGKYLILPPDYNGAVPQGYFVARSKSYVNLIMVRGFLVNGKPDYATKLFKSGFKVYPLKDVSNPPKMEYISASTKIFNTIHANNFEFYNEINHVIQKEPISMISPQLRGLFASIGIEKGKPFVPDARMQKILVDAAAVGNATVRALSFAPRDQEVYMYKNTYWKNLFIGGSYEWLKNNGLGGRNLDARALYFYIATINTPAMAAKMVGKGSQYGVLNRDQDGKYLDGGKNYELTIPANVPAKDFWSVVAYDPQTRSQLQTSQPFPSRNNKRDKLIENSDGSVTIYFGATAPKGKESNWIQTVPNKGWFILLRLYGPLEPWFDKTWQPGNIVEVK